MRGNLPHPNRSADPSFCRPAWLSLLALASAHLLFTGVARAPFTEYIVNDDTRGEEHRRDPAGTPLENGGYLLGWSDNARGHSDVVVLPWNAADDSIGVPFRLNGDNTMREHRDLELSRPGGGVIAATWIDNRGGTPNVYARLLSADDGQPVSADFRVSDAADSSTTEDASVVTQSNGSSLIVWSGQPSGHTRVSYQSIDAAGVRQGLNREVAPESSGRDQARGTASPLPGGGWIVVWDELVGRDHDVFFRMLDASGQPTGAIRQANASSASDQLDPAVLVRTNDILIAWRDNRQLSADVWGRWFALDGTPEAGGDLALREAGDPSEDLFPRLAVLDDDSFAISWLGGIGNRQRYFARFFAADRTPLSDSMLLSDPPSGSTVSKGVLFPRGDRWEYAWADDHTLTAAVYHQTHDRNGTALEAARTAYRLPGSSSQVYPDVALFPDGGAIVTYGDLQFGQLNIMARFLDSTGAPTGESFQVNDEPVGRGFDTADGIEETLNNFGSSVAACSTGFVVTWAIDQQGGRLRLWGQLYDREGGRVGGNFSVLTVNAEGIPQYDARPIMRRDGSFIITWRDNSSDDDGDIYYRNYSPEGLPIGGPVNCADVEGGVRTRPQQLPAIGISPFDLAAVAWIDKRSGGWDIWSQLILPDGQTTGANVAQNFPDAITIDQLNPSIALGEDRVVTIFEEQPLATGQLRGRLEIFETLLRASEQARGGGGRAEPNSQVVEFDVTSGAQPVGLKYPCVAMEPSGRFIVTWADNRDGIRQVWAQRFDPQGAPVGETYPLTLEQAGSRLGPQVAVNRDVVQLVWTDTRRERGWDIVARRVDWNYGGGPVAIELADWRAESTPTGLEVAFSVSPDLASRRFRVWRDAIDVAADHPSASAFLVTPELLQGQLDYRVVDTGAEPNQWYGYYVEGIDDRGMSDFAGPLRARWDAAPLAWSAQPNPSRDTVVLRAPTVGPHRVTLLDLAGRRVRALNGSGSMVSWDGRDEAGRLVPTGVYWAQPESGSALRVLILR